MSGITENNKVMCGVCHIGNVLAPFTLVTGLVAPIIYFVKKAEGDEVLNFQAKQCTIYFLLQVVIAIVCMVIGLISGFICPLIPCILFPLVWLAVAGYAIYTSVMIFQGENIRIPMVADWADQLNI